MAFPFFRKSQERCDMSAMKPATCSRCTNIVLEEHDNYSLGSLGYMASSSCLGCRFFVDVAQRYNLNIADEKQTQMLMRRSFKDANLVDVYYVCNKSGESSTVRTHKLRLCATFGMCLNHIPNSQYQS